MVFIPDPDLVSGRIPKWPRKLMVSALSMARTLEHEHKIGRTLDMDSFTAVRHGFGTDAEWQTLEEIQEELLGLLQEVCSQGWVLTAVKLVAPHELKRCSTRMGPLRHMTA